MRIQAYDPLSQLTGPAAKTAESVSPAAGALPEEESVVDELLPEEPENVDTVVFEQEKEKQPWEIGYQESKFKVATSPPQDSSGPLTSRLVASLDEMGVRSVISSAYKDMLGLRIAAASGDKESRQKAQKILRRYEKLLDRCYTKITSLKKELNGEMQAKKAAQQKQDLREREIRDELRAEKRRRRNQENAWLREKSGEALRDTLESVGSKMSGTTSAQPNSKLDTVSEAEIAAEAAAQAAAEFAAGTGGGGGSTAAAISAYGGNAAAAGKGAAAAAAGGEGGAEAGGGEAGVDISV